MRGASKARRWVVIHPLLVRLTHWVNAAAITCMVMSGWQIYNASPLFGFRFPNWATLGGWLGGAIAWHLAVMWALVCNGLIYVTYGLVARHFRRKLLPLTPRMVLADLRAALRFSLPHETGVYNAVQRLFYIGVLCCGVTVVCSGLLLWKPVQFDAVLWPLGGFQVMRRVHFAAMSGIVAFVVVHLALVALVPKTLPSMITGRARVESEH